MWGSRAQLAAGTSALLVHPFLYAGGHLGGEELEVLGSTVSGLVVRGKAGAGKLTALRRERDCSCPAVVDPACYERPTFHPDSHVESLFGIDGYWLGLQQDHGVAAYLSPSLYIPAGDERRLHEVLTAGERFCADANAMSHRAPAFIVLPVARYWLSADLQRFADAVAAASAPLALVLADRNDPLGSRAAVEGLCYLLRRVPTLALLRTDLAAMGAIAYGASFTAIGSGTSVRHLVPPGQQGGGTRDDPTPSVLVEPLLAYRKGSWLAQLEEDGGALDCGCVVCSGQTLRRFDDPSLATEARLHSAVTWKTIADRLLSYDPRQRPAAWTRMCTMAIYTHEDLADRTGVPLSPPAYLSAWAGSGS